MPEHRTRAPGPVLRVWLGLSAVVAPLARWHLRRRAARGKEDPARMREKLGFASLPRPEGALVWMHAVGVGEALALPALIRAMRAQRPDISVLITTSSRTSAAALAANMPEGAVHQFLPLDARPFLKRFLDHWRPDLSVWAERDLWPAMVWAVDRRGIPLALVNGRLTEASARAKRRAGGLYRDLLRRFAHLGAQEPDSAARFAMLGAGQVQVTGSLKAGADALADQPEARAHVAARLRGRRVWIAASTHPGDEAAVARAQRQLLGTAPETCLIVAPRDPSRAAQLCDALAGAGLAAARIGAGNLLPDGDFDTLVLGEVGQLGLWYRVADAAFVGGSIAPVGGHNPYEPARLDCAVLHGPHVGNFAPDYAAFHAAGAAREVRDGPSLAAALSDPGCGAMRPAAATVAAAGRAALQAEARRLLDLLERRNDA